MSCPYCHGTRRIPVEIGGSLSYDCPDCRNPAADDNKDADPAPHNWKVNGDLPEQP
jgi:hypothetical protein